MKNTILSIVLLFSFSLSAQITHSCQTQTSEQSLNQLKTFTSHFYKKNEKIRKTAPTLKTLPITFHLVGNDNGDRRLSLDDALRLLCSLNEVMDTAQLFFYLNEIRFINNTEWNENGQDFYSQLGNQNIENTINVYVLGSTNSSDLCGVYVGSAVSQGNGGGSPDIIALSRTCANASTLAHEIGHFLTLPHTFYGWEGRGTEGNTGNAPDFAERVDGSNCNTAGDLICDTEPDYLYARWIGNNCSESGVVSLDIDGESVSIELTDPDGTAFSVSGINMMSYGSNDCRAFFTTDQIAAMHFNLENFRTNLLSQNITSTPVERANLISPKVGDTTAFDVVTLDWEAVENATHYAVQVNLIPTFVDNLMIAEGVTTENSFQIFGLDPNRRLYWRVIPYNNGNTCQNAVSENFRVGTFTADNENKYEIEEIIQLSLQPNPVVRQQNFLLRLFIKETVRLDFSIYSMNGQFISTINYSLNSGNQIVNLPHSDLPTGVYLIVIQNGEKRIIEKLVVL